jgi:prepilin-type N-terminal cleavage/methylation domain-containing protein
MNIKRQGGFTLIEIMVVITILGILGATAIPFYRTWRERSMAAEARIMVKQIFDAEIAYYLDKNNFYPIDVDYIDVWDDFPRDHENVKKISTGLNIIIPTGHFLNYQFTVDRGDPTNPRLILMITSSTGGNIFGDTNEIVYILDKSGKISNFLS